MPVWLKLVGVISTIICAVSLNQFFGIDPVQCGLFCKELIDGVLVST